MSVERMLEHNRRFVEGGGYEEFVTSKYPDRKVAVLTCMDTRLVRLLPAALGVGNGDIKLIKNAGGVVSNPFGSAVRSILVGIYELGIEDVMVIGHTDCGAQHICGTDMVNRMMARGITEEMIATCRYFEVDFDHWLCGFDSVEMSVRESVRTLREHPLIPDDVRIWGFIIDSVTGELTPVE